MTTFEASETTFEATTETPSSRGVFSIFFFLVPLTVAVFGYFLIQFSTSLQSTFFLGVRGDQGSTQSLAFNPNSGNSSISSLFTPSVHYWEQDILRWSAEFNMDPDMVATLIQIESCGDPKAESYAGAASLFQVMPFHFQDTEDPFEVETNAFRGLTYLDSSLDAADGDIGLAFAGYNGGIGVIELDPSEWAQQTRDYQYWAENIFADIKAGSSETIDEWLGAGGHSLCKAAENRLTISSTP